jgi:hypothetical protein
MYLTLAIDDDTAHADAKLNAYLEQYYAMPAAVTRKRQMSYAGPAAGAAAWLKSYADGGASHLVLRFAGDHERQLEIAARVRRELGW